MNADDTEHHDDMEPAPDGDDMFARFLDEVERDLATITAADHQAALDRIFLEADGAYAAPGPSGLSEDLAVSHLTSVEADEVQAVLDQVADDGLIMGLLLESQRAQLQTSRQELESTKSELQTKKAELAQSTIEVRHARALSAAAWDAAEKSKAEARQVVIDAEDEAAALREASRDAAITQSVEILKDAKKEADELLYGANVFFDTISKAAAQKLCAPGDDACIHGGGEESALTAALARLGVAVQQRDAAGFAQIIDSLPTQAADGGTWLLTQLAAASLRLDRSTDVSTSRFHSEAIDLEQSLAASTSAATFSGGGIESKGGFEAKIVPKSRGHFGGEPEMKIYRGDLVDQRAQLKAFNVVQCSDRPSHSSESGWMCSYSDPDSHMTLVFYAARSEAIQSAWADLSPVSWTSFLDLAQVPVKRREGSVQTHAARGKAVTAAMAGFLGRITCSDWVLRTVSVLLMIGAVGGVLVEMTGLLRLSQPPAGVGIVAGISSLVSWRMARARADRKVSPGAPGRIHRRHTP